MVRTIEYDPQNLTGFNAAAGVGILTDHDNVVDAVLSRLPSLPIDHRHERDPEHNVTYLLVQHHLGQVRVVLYLLVSLA